MHKSVIAGVLVVLLLVGLFFYLDGDTGNPCRKIRQACESAGYIRGKSAAERRAFGAACLRPVLEGEPVANVVVDPDDIAACKQKQDRKRRRTRDSGSEKEAFRAEELHKPSA